MKIAIVGAGLAGTTAAYYLLKDLSRTGLAVNDATEITLFEKSRGLGGRMANRRTEEFNFDHGAQYFTIRENSFRDFIDQLPCKAVQEWDINRVRYLSDGTTIPVPHNEPRYVAIPNMSSLCGVIVERAASLQELTSAQFTVSLNTRVNKIEKSDGKWRLLDEDKVFLGDFDWLVSAIPAPQATALLPGEFEHAERLSTVRMIGCYTLLLGLKEPLDIEWDGASISVDHPKSELIAWMAVNNKKPSRRGGFSLVVQATNEWSERHMNDSDEKVIFAIRTILNHFVPIDESNIRYQSLHRWRYADVIISHREKCMVDTRQKLAACGDWCIAGRVEAAFVSGKETAHAIVKHSLQNLF